MAFTTDDFNKIWASTSPLTPYEFSESQYKDGWNFIGGTPPSRQMWDFLQKNNDEKMQYLANNYLPLSGGTMTGDITVSSTDWKIKCNVDDKSLNFWAGSDWSKGAYLSLHGINHAQYPGWFRIYARDSNTSVELRGKPDGSLIWFGNSISVNNGGLILGQPSNAGWIIGNTETFSISNKYNNTEGAIDIRSSVNSYKTGAELSLYGTGHANQAKAGNFYLSAATGDGSIALEGKKDGTLTWDGQPLLPVGVVQAFAGSTTPAGWLLCDGSAVSRTTYAKLFAVIGTTYGAGDGSTTFNLPDLVDKFVEGSATAGTVKNAGLPNITGMVRPLDGILNINASYSGAFTTTSLDNPERTLEVGNFGNSVREVNFNASLSNSIYGNSTTVQPPALTMQYIIKY